MAIIGLPATGFGVARWLNCVRDPNVGRAVSAKVVEKHVTHGKHGTHYYIRVAPWSPALGADPIQLSVSKAAYEHTAEGYSVAHLTVRDGGLGVPWVERVDVPE